MSTSQKASSLEGTKLDSNGFMYLLSPGIFIHYNSQHQKSECFCPNVSSIIFTSRVTLGKLLKPSLDLMFSVK